ncbi:hypothetical protein [Thiocapsa rosea]|uniref:Uncharacterized protein n=1 Tax=Thiocapsa rosea TaxID=69360 RepID=A0A495VDW1_9GAMM|nr:hypothetical protein [Thiocapsa rosea]RKT46625.1 hypothetical protein BDD21_4149 [Thiocapsa rosea]
MYLHPQAPALRSLPPYRSVFGVYFDRLGGIFRPALCVHIERDFGIGPFGNEPTSVPVGFCCPLQARDYWADFELLAFP